MLFFKPYYFGTFFSIKAFFNLSLWPYSLPVCRGNCLPWAICPSAEGLEVLRGLGSRHDCIFCCLSPKKKGRQFASSLSSSLWTTCRSPKQQGQHCFIPRHWRANCPTSASGKDSSTGIMITGQDALINHLKRHPNAKCCNHQRSLQLCGLNFGLPKYANGSRNSNCWPKHVNRTLDPQGCPLPSHFLHHFQTSEKKK